ncbi:MAG: 3-oxoacyl-[acyl-carrier-protein] synthase III [archaeon GW2011_AR4]|nr:MAG: 3-oxoacyl-[acyl-carrier-protein] synthase III [archaeon GW2011_AR4]
MMERADIWFMAKVRQALGERALPHDFVLCAPSRMDRAFPSIAATVAYGIDIPPNNIPFADIFTFSRDLPSKLSFSLATASQGFCSDPLRAGVILCGDVEESTITDHCGLWIPDDMESHIGVFPDWVMSPPRRTAQLSAVALYQPPLVLDNATLSRVLESGGFEGTSDEWMLPRTGMRQGYIELEKTLDEMAIAASENLLDKYPHLRSSIDLVAVATCSRPGYDLSSTDPSRHPVAANVANHLGIHDDAFDLQAACSGFPYTLAAVTSLVSMGYSGCALLICAEKFSSILDYQDRSSAPLFGDIAAACLVTPSDEGVQRVQLHGDGSPGMQEMLTTKWDDTRYIITQDDGVLCLRQDPGWKVVMNGRRIYQWALQTPIPAIVEYVQESGGEDFFNRGGIIIPHSANARITSALREQLHAACSNFPDSAVIDIVEQYRNVSGASPLVGLYEVEQQVLRAKRNPPKEIIFAGFGAGMTWGIVHYKP